MRRFATTWIIDRRHFLTMSAGALAGLAAGRAKMREAVTVLRQQKAAFLGILGDIKDMAPKEPEAKTLAGLAAIEAEIQRFGGPTYHVLGNHDMDNISKTQMLAGITTMPAHTIGSMGSTTTRRKLWSKDPARRGTPTRSSRWTRR